MVLEYKVTIDEGVALVEDVVVRFQVEDITLLKLISLLDFIEDHKGHVAESKSQEFLENEPVVIFTVESNAFDFRELIIIVITLSSQSRQVLKIVESVSCFLLYENDRAIYSDISVSFVIPEYFEISFAEVDGHHLDVFKQVPLNHCLA